MQLTHKAAYPQEALIAAPGVSGGLDKMWWVQHKKHVATVFSVWIFYFVHLVMKLEKGTVYRESIAESIAIAASQNNNYVVQMITTH